MRIGLVFDDSLDGTDGVQQYVLRVGEWLQKQGHDVFYLVGETRRTDIKNLRSLSTNLHVRFNGNTLSTPLPARKRVLRAVLVELRLDVLHVQTPYSPFMAGRLIKLAHKRTAIVGTFHILPYSTVVRLLSILPRVVNWRSARKFDTMMSVSVPAQAFARSHYGLKSVVVPNCFDFRQFTDAKSEVPTKQIVYLGRLVPRKGPMELLSAIAVIAEQGQWPKGWKVRIGGKGPLVHDMQAYIARYGLDKLVTLDGFIAESDKAQYLAQSDIAVFPSVAGESFGISLLEAMAAVRGVVLGGDNPGYRSVMEGFEDQLFDPHNTVVFAELLLQWMRDDAKRSAIVKCQRSYVEQFDTNIVGRKILEQYDKALQKRRLACHN